MTDTLSTTSELSAVNTIISMVGKSPLNSLSNLTDVEAITAQSILLEVTREVQTKGHSFNTEACMTLSRDLSTNKISVPLNTAMFRPSPIGGNADDKLVERGGFVYDVTNETFVFTADVEAELVLLYTFDKLPQYARQYIMIRAGRIFQDRQRVSETRHRFTIVDERDAQMAFTKNETRVKAHQRNLKRGGGYIAETIHRRRFLGRQ